MGCSSYSKTCWKCWNEGHIETVRGPWGPEHRCLLCQSRQFPHSKGLTEWHTWNKLKYRWMPHDFEHFNIWTILGWSLPEPAQGSFNLR